MTETIHLNQIPMMQIDPSWLDGKPLAAAVNSKDGCKCSGTGFIHAVLPGQLFPVEVPCEHCQRKKYLERSGLNVQERGLTLREITQRDDDATGEIAVLRLLCKAMLKDPYGMLTLTGPCGTAKSLALKALVATFARDGKKSYYTTLPTIRDRITPKYQNDGTADFDGVSADVWIRRLRETPVLAIDEMDKALWTPYLANTLGDVIDERHRSSETLVTLIGMNLEPVEWSVKPGANVQPILSRLMDGRFNRKWPSKIPVPPCIATNRFPDGNNFAPGYFRTTLPDMRPNLYRADQPDYM